jgi:hypothetical protein
MQPLLQGPLHQSRTPDTLHNDRPEWALPGDAFFTIAGLQSQLQTQGLSFNHEAWNCEQPMRTDLADRAVSTSDVIFCIFPDRTRQRDCLTVPQRAWSSHA